MAGLVFFRHRTRVRLPHALLVVLWCSGSTLGSQPRDRGSTPRRTTTGMWESLGIRLAWDQEIGGSNPSIPTRCQESHSAWERDC